LGFRQTFLSIKDLYFYRFRRFIIKGS